MRVDELEQLVSVVHEKMDIEGDRRNSEMGIVHTPRVSQISEDGSNFMKRRRMLRKRLSKTFKEDVDATRIANESMMSPLSDSKDNLARVLVDLKVILNSSKKMNPSLLLLMCELKGWMAPVDWNIKQCMRELAGTDSIEEDAGLRKMSWKMSFYRPFDNGFVGSSPADQTENRPPGAALKALNSVTPIPEEEEIELPEKKQGTTERDGGSPELNSNSSDNEEVTQSLLTLCSPTMHTLHSIVLILSDLFIALCGAHQGKDDKNRKSSLVEPQGQSSSTVTEQDGSASSASTASPVTTSPFTSGYKSALRWKKNTVTPQKTKTASKKDVSVGNLLQVSPAPPV